MKIAFLVLSMIITTSVFAETFSLGLITEYSCEESEHNNSKLNLIQTTSAAYYVKNQGLVFKEFTNVVSETIVVKNVDISQCIDAIAKITKK